MTPKTPESNGSRRKASRVRSTHLLTVTKTKDKAQAREETSISIARTLDVSSAGIRVEVEVLSCVCIDDQLQLEIAVEDRVILAQGTVVHARRKEDHLVEIGIEFTSIADADRDALAAE